ncbi:MAG: hypothetical protein M3N07_05465 [Pseudomonadota bacterium]|nr:hypothetical protein [Pseudomonadota bacterium]
MRDILSKVMTGSMVAGAALLVAACGGNETNNAANTTVDNGLGTTIDAPLDNGFGDMNTMGGNVTGDLNQAENAISNAAEAIENAQSNVQ